MIGKRIGIIGLGRFGRLLGDILGPDFEVTGFDHDSARASSFEGAAPLAQVAASDSVFFCVPISSLEAAMTEALPHLRDDAVVFDVCSVKVRPVEIMERLLSPATRILPTHPMFGPDSWARGNRPLPFVLCPTDRTPPEDEQRVVEYLGRKGFTIVRMTADEHDRAMAYSLCLTQLVGRAVDRLGLEESPSDTASFRQLLEIRRIACNDTKQLFRDMQLSNPYAAEMRRRLIAALNAIEEELG